MVDSPITKRTLSESAIKHYRAPNGMGVTIVTRPDSRQFAANLVFKTGYRYDPDDATGLSHLVEHLLMEGPAREEGERLSRRGVWVNASTALERTYVWTSGPMSELEGALAFLMNKLLPRTVTKDELTREIAIIEQEEIGRGYSAWDATYDFHFGMLVGAKEGWLGTLSNIPELRSLSPQRVSEFIRERFSPNNAWLVITSDRDDRNFTCLTEGSLPLSRMEPPADIQEECPPELPPHIIRRYRKAPQSWVSIAAHYRPCELYKGAPIAILCEVLGAAPHGRIFSAVRTENGMGYDQGLTTLWLDDCAVLNLYALVEKRHAANCFAALNAIVEDLRTQGLSTDEFEESKLRVCHHLQSLEDDPISLCAFLAERTLHDDNPPASPADARSALDSLTLEQTNAVARRLFRPERCLPAVIGSIGWWAARKLRKQLDGNHRNITHGSVRQNA